jgi:hypothetical protein
MPGSDRPAKAPAKPAGRPAKPRGGARKGTGPKAPDGVKGRRRQLTLDDATVATFARLGGGNVSLGAREAARLAAAAASGVFLPAPPTGG